MKITVIIPTFNEQGVIRALLEAIETEIKKIPQHQITILIIDGHSTDGTGTIVQSLRTHYPNLYLIVEEEKRGLGVAYVHGIQFAIEQLHADAYIEFDGDFQHDPRDIARLIAEFDQGYDYVIGSRYVAGGQVPAHWAFYRKLLSKYGSLLARWLLQLPIRDTTSGLKLSRVKFFSDRLSLEEAKLLSKRHAYKIQLLCEMVRAGARVKEIPITFLERESGSSKSSLEDIKESLRVIWKLY